MPDLNKFAEQMNAARNWEMAGDQKQAYRFAYAAMLALFGLDAE